MITLKNGTFSIGAEGSYQNWLCRFKDALKGKGKHKLKDFEAFMFGEKIKKAGLEAGLTKERINQDWLEAHNEVQS